MRDGRHDPSGFGVDGRRDELKPTLSLWGIVSRRIDRFLPPGIEPTTVAAMPTLTVNTPAGFDVIYLLSDNYGRVFAKVPHLRQHWE